MSNLDHVWKAGSPFYRTGFSNGPLQRLISKAVVEKDESGYLKLLEQILDAGKRAKGGDRRDEL